MKQFIDKLISRLEERKGKYFDGLTCEGTMIKVNDAISIVNQLAEEYKVFGNSEQVKGGWIPVSERLPEKCGYYIITVFDGKNYKTKVACYDRIGYLCQQNIKAQWWDELTCDAELIERCGKKVIAWMPLPEPYQKEGE